MDFQKYQQAAAKTAQIARSVDTQALTERIIPLLGLAGETGELLSEYKKHLRDGPSHTLFRERVAEELGDLLWYISEVASKFSLDLGEIAEANLRKVEKRWLSGTALRGPYNFDERFPEGERLPRQFRVEIIEVSDFERIKVQVHFEGIQIGNELTDNSHYPDGYRFHDVFHLAHAAILGWSPVTRSIMARKRKSDKAIDEVEDGGRAIAIEEGVTALVFAYAESHEFLRDITQLDYGLLKNVAYMTSRLEVSRCSTADWEKSILLGYGAWRTVTEARGGIIIGDLDKQTLVVE